MLVVDWCLKMGFLFGQRLCLSGWWIGILGNLGYRLFVQLVRAVAAVARCLLLLVSHASVECSHRLT